MFMPHGAPNHLNWRKATYSIANGDCAEVASVSGSVVIRDTKDPYGLILRYPSDSWRSFIGKARSGSFDVVRLWYAVAMCRPTVGAPRPKWLCVAGAVWTATVRNPRSWVTWHGRPPL